MDRTQVESLWAHLHALTVLAEQGSFTAAAARLRISKAAMSQRIAELEQAAGVQLVQRTTRSMRLTEAGRSLVDELSGSFEHIAASFTGLGAASAAPRGLVRVTTAVALGRQQIVPRIAEFLRAYPGIRIELDLSDRIRILSRDGFDLAIRHSAMVPDTHVALELCRSETLLVAHPGYLKRRGAPRQPEDLAAHDCLFYPRGERRVEWRLQPANAGGRGKAAAREPAARTVAVSGSFAANNSEALRDAALAGLGIAMLPDFSAQQALRGRELVVVLPGWRPVDAFADRIFAVRPYSPHVPKAVSVFVAYLRERLAPGFGG
ncbi:MAG: LysR family transcriptional regulator [Burkholderiaceae bacterium]